MSIIVLEGPDLAGKTTLATEFASHGSHLKRVLKQGPPSGDIITRYLKPIEELQVGEPFGTDHDVLILDRWHVGELVYGPMLRGKSQLTQQQANYVDMVLQAFGCLFLHIDAPDRILEDRYDIRGDSLVKRDQVLQVAEWYRAWMSHRTHWVTHVIGGPRDWSFSPLFAAPLAGQYIGPRKPRVLLLGDERASDEFIFPFVPRRATSGHWLMGALSAANVDHMQVGIINACEVESNALFTQWDALGKPPVIALGRNAQKAWAVVDHYMDSRTSTTHLNHPQYERRFHYTQMQRYGQVIKGVMDNG